MNGEFSTLDYRGWEINVHEYPNGRTQYTVWTDEYFRTFDNLDDAYTYIDEVGFNRDYSLGTPH